MNKYRLVVNGHEIIDSYHPFENILDFIKNKAYKKAKSDADVLECEELKEGLDECFGVQITDYDGFLNAALKDFQEIQEEVLDSDYLKRLEKDFIESRDRGSGEAITEEYIKNSPVVLYKDMCNIVSGLYVYSYRYRAMIPNPQKVLTISHIRVDA